MKIVGVHPESIAQELGLAVGDELLEMNSQRVQDNIDYRFLEGEAEVSLKVIHGGAVQIFDIEKDEGEPLGIELEEMKILSCGNECIFCFVDQNPAGLRKELYFRDGDYRLSFMYGNYTTMTNAGPAILRRIITQRLAPQYISVHATDLDVRRTLMGITKDDFILEKIKLLHDNNIEMHTQIVLCPGLNDGPVLQKTVRDLYAYRKQIVSLAVVPVGLTDHRFGLTRLRRVDAAYARELLTTVDAWQREFRKALGRAFVYASDEFFITARRPIPGPAAYDGFPQLENGVGMVRAFLTQFGRQARNFPPMLGKRRTLNIVTGELAQGFMREVIVPRLAAIKNLRVNLVVAPNLLYGRSVTVAGLLSGNSVSSSLEGVPHGDLVLLPPDILNTSGVFLDDVTPADLASRIGSPLQVFGGRWGDVIRTLTQQGRRQRTGTLVQVSHTQGARP
jgi:putative radical SAM enzyme (TIGR03279 family)